VDREQLAPHTDQERPALLAFVLLRRPAAGLEALPQRVDEGRRHEGVQVAGGLGQGQRVADELAHPERRGEAEQIALLAEHLGVGTHGQAHAGDPGAVTADVDRT